MSELICTGTPVSWLRLERFVLGELSDEEARAVDAHLQACPACQACADACAEPVALLPLPSLPSLTSLTPLTLGAAPAASSDAPVVQPLAPVLTHPSWQRRARVAVPVALGLAAAAALLLFVFPPSDPREPERGITRVIPSDPPREAVGASDAAVPPTRADLTLTVLRERDGSVVEGPQRFLLSDRFAVLLSCRPGFGGQQRVAVYQGGEWSLPLSGDDVRCGNRVRVPGAFQLSEPTPADICVLWGETALKASTASAELPAPAALREAACQRVEPVTPPNLR
jgi:hypothetical protein